MRTQHEKIKNTHSFYNLFLISVLLTLAYNLYKGETLLSILKYDYTIQSFTNFHEGELLSKNKATGEFKARENNLGIVEIRFNDYGRINTDSVVFRLKEKGVNKWYYEQVYKAREFGGYPLFPFGFPIIENSKDKIYFFELESLHGRPGNAIAISTDEPVATLKYKFNIRELLIDKKAFLLFLAKKSGELIQDFYILRLSLLIFIVFISPFLLFKLYSRINIPKKYITKLKVKSIKEASSLQEHFSLKIF